MTGALGDYGVAGWRSAAVGGRRDVDRAEGVMLPMLSDGLAAGPNVGLDEELAELLSFASAEVGAPVRFVPRYRWRVVPAAAAGGASVQVVGCRAVHGTLHVGSSAALETHESRFLAAVARLIAERLDRRVERARAARARGERVRGLLESSALSVVYQPIRDLRSGDTVGVEALSRFADDSRLPHGWFLEAAAVGMGLELESTAVATAIRAFDTLPPDVYLSVNVSPDAASTSRLRHTLRGVPVERLVFEITEHDEVTDYEQLNAALQPLRRRGLRLAVDDAGAGFASLRHILRIQPDIIKLDMSLVRDIDRDAVLRALSYSIAAFGSAVGASVVAEGIESTGELAALKFLGIQFGQGFLLQAPAALEELGLARPLSPTTPA